MMKKKNIAYYLIFLIILGLLGCKDEFKRYYEKGINQKLIIQVLEEEGDYTLFLDALDLLGYKEILSSSGLFTVLAVNDTDFRKYMETKGYSSIPDIPKEELNAIITYHILDWAYSSSSLISGYSNEPTMIRKLTRMTPPAYKDINETSGLEYIVASERKLMPFFSQQYVDAMEITTQDIMDFYPGLDVDLPGGDIIASDGILLDTDIEASNGWVHRIDRVCTILRNHQDVLKTESDFTLYNDIASMFAEYEFDLGYTNDLEIDENGNGDYDSVFVKDWFQFNREYVGIKGTRISSESDTKKVQKNFVTAFIPNNVALQQFFTKYYPLIPVDEIKNNIAEPALSTIIGSCVYSGIAYFPSYVASGQLITKYGTPYIVEENNITKKEMVSNGLFYGTNKYRVPDEFDAVTVAFMTDTTYSYFLIALEKTGFLKLLVSESIDFTIFSLKNETFRETGYFLNNNQNGFVDEDGKNVGNNTLKSMLNNHIILGKLDIPGLSSTLFVNNITPEEEYIRISDSTISANGVDMAQLLDDGSDIENGLIYELNSFLLPVEIGMVDYIKTTSKFSDFYSKLVEVGIFDKDMKTVMFNEGQITCFAPTNAALSAVELPTDPEELMEYLSRFFVKKVIFTDGQKQGQFETFGKYNDNDSKKYVTINIVTNNGVITVTNQITGDSSDTDYEDDVMLYEGSLHTINSIY